MRYSTPPGHVGTRVWCRVVGEELAITARTGQGLAEITRHRLSTPGNPSVLDEHYPHHPGGRGVHRPTPKARTPEEVAFLALGEGAHRWPVEAASAGTVRVRSKMRRAVELAAVIGADTVDEALGLAAIAGRFADDDLPCIVDHLAGTKPVGQVVVADENHSVQPGTGGWEVFGR